MDGLQVLEEVDLRYVKRALVGLNCVDANCLIISQVLRFQCPHGTTRFPNPAIGV